jgi:hypothetical protein
MKFTFSAIILAASIHAAPAQTDSGDLVPFATIGQSLLGGFEPEAVQKIISLTEFTSRSDFGDSKPTVSKDSLKVYAYRPTLTESDTEYDQVWYKFKSPEAINDVVTLAKSGQSVKADKVLERAFQDARKLVPEAAAKVDALGYKFTFAQQNMIAGFAWIPSTITLELRGENEIFVNTPTLISAKQIPTIGGMHYCKIFTPIDAARILTDLAAKNHDKIPFQNPQVPSLNRAGGESHAFTEFSWDGNKAYVVVDKSVTTFKGTFIISPGGFIPSISMRGLAKTVASEGYVVFIVLYPSDAAFWELLDAKESRTISLAQLIKSKNSKALQSLPESIKAFYGSASAPVIVFGHSLGGAALGPAIFGNVNPFDTIILYGSATFLKGLGQGAPVAENVASFFGQNENKNEETFKNARAELGIENTADSQGVYRSATGNRSMQIIPELSHFCIISDLKVGQDQIRNSDGVGPAPSVAVKKLVAHFIGRGLL